MFSISLKIYGILCRTLRLTTVATFQRAVEQAISNGPRDEFEMRLLLLTTLMSVLPWPQSDMDAVAWNLRTQLLCRGIDNLLCIRSYQTGLSARSILDFGFGEENRRRKGKMLVIARHYNWSNFRRELNAITMLRACFWVMRGWCLFRYGRRSCVWFWKVN